jgi:cell wall-associated NlpC family hydrolase
MSRSGLALTAAAATLALSACSGAGMRPAAHPHAQAPARSRPAHRATAIVAEVPDPLAAQSYPEPAAAARHARAAAPRVAATHAVGGASPGAPSLTEVERQLREERRLVHRLARHEPASIVDQLTGAFRPRNVVPRLIAQVIAGGNAIADFPYVYGGGHLSFVDRAYDCSGSVSYALAAAGLIGAPETSGQLESWGAPGPGRWITVFANAGHTFMNVDGLWFDTAGRSGPYSTRWLTATPPLRGYAVRHYPGL